MRLCNAMVLNRDVQQRLQLSHRDQNMEKNDFFEAIGGMEYMIIFSFLFVGATVIAWCLTSAVSGPLEHISCPLLSMF